MVIKHDRSFSKDGKVIVSGQLAMVLQMNETDEQLIKGEEAAWKKSQSR